MIRRLLPVFASCAASLPLLFGCGDSPDALDASTIDAQPNGGNFTLAWTIVDGEATLPCRDVGAVAVAITLIRQGAGAGTAESFPCTAGEAVSRTFPPGIYDFTIDVRASGSKSLLAAPVRIQGFEILARQESALPAQEFAIEPIGDFNFFVDTGATAGNCAATEADGGGIVGLSFSLENSSGACVEAEFVIADGSESGGTYTSNCTTPPAPFGCIGSDQQVSVTGTRSGALKLEVVGEKAGPIDCYDRVSNFDLPGAGLLKELGVLLLSLEYSVECDPDFSLPDGGMGGIDAGVPDASL